MWNKYPDVTSMTRSTDEPSLALALMGLYDADGVKVEAPSARGASWVKRYLGPHSAWESPQGEIEEGRAVGIVLVQGGDADSCLLEHDAWGSQGEASEESRGRDPLKESSW